jgi:hypothetical protein
VTIGQQMKRRLTQTDEMTNVPKDNRVWCGDTTGFIWTLNGFPIVVPSEVKKVVDEAFTRFPELTFGAFDVVYNVNTNRAYVIEINSAPMMTPETARRYGDFFRKYAETLPQVTAQPVVEAPVPVPPSVEDVARVIADRRNALVGLPPAFWSDGEWNGTDLVLSPFERELYRELAVAAMGAVNVQG